MILVYQESTSFARTSSTWSVTALPGAANFCCTSKHAGYSSLHFFFWWVDMDFVSCHRYPQCDVKDWTQFFLVCLSPFHWNAQWGTTPFAKFPNTVNSTCLSTNTKIDFTPHAYPLDYENSTLVFYSNVQCRQQDLNSLWGPSTLMSQIENTPWWIKLSCLGKWAGVNFHIWNNARGDVRWTWALLVTL